MNGQDWINAGVVAAAGVALTTPFVGAWVRDRLTGQSTPVLRLEDISYEIPVHPPTLLEDRTDVALAWNRAAARSTAPQGHGTDDDLDDVEPVDRSAFDPDVYYGWADR